MNAALEQGLLRQLLYYDPVSGLFTWMVARPNRPIGSQAGYLSAKGYRIICVDGVQYKAHRLAWLYMTGVWPNDQVDHLDGDKDNNRWVNLRSASTQENCCNRVAHCTNTTGFKGVTKKGEGRFIAQIMVRGQKLHLGSFNSPQEAHAAYCAAATELHGEFANTTSREVK